MKLIVRTRNILFSPKTEWARIEQENDPPGQLLTSYLLWIALIPAVASFIGYGLIGFRISIFSNAASLNWGIKMAIQQYISIIGGVYLTAFVFNILAPNFGAQKNFPKAFQLVAYCYTAICIGGIFYIHWKLSFLAGLTGLYGLFGYQQNYTRLAKTVFSGDRLYPFLNQIKYFQNNLRKET